MGEITLVPEVFSRSLRVGMGRRPRKPRKKNLWHPVLGEICDIMKLPVGAWWYLQLTQQFGIIHAAFFSHSPTAAHFSQPSFRSSIHSAENVKQKKQKLNWQYSLSLYSSFVAPLLFIANPGRERLRRLSR